MIRGSRGLDRMGSEGVSEYQFPTPLLNRVTETERIGVGTLDRSRFTLAFLPACFLDLIGPAHH